MDLDSCLDEFTHRDWEAPTDEGPMRLAMIALGWWTREKAIPAVQESDLCTTTVVASSDAEKAEQVAAEWDTIEHALTYDEFHAGTAVDAYDAVYICTPNALHLPYAESAADHGKAVLCEKPMEASVKRAEKMIAACDEGGVPLMIAYRMQTEPAVRRARELVQDGTIGEPVFVHGNMSQPLLELISDVDQWRLDPDFAGYGASIMDIGLYPLNTARYVLERDPVHAQAMVGSLDERFEDIPDERAAFQLEFEGNVLGSFTASQNAAQSSHLRVIGTEGEIKIDPAFFPWTDRGFRLQHNDTVVDLEWEQVNQMTEEFDYFGNCVLTDKKPQPDGRHGLVDMRTLKAIYRAAESKSMESV